MSFDMDNPTALNWDKFQFIHNDDVLVYQYDISKQPIDTSFLTKEEIVRCHRFRFEDDQKRYCAGRSIVRRYIASSQGVEPLMVNIEVDQNGKPYVKGSLQFNISHSGHFVMVGFSNSVVGVDVEFERHIKDIRGMVDRVFTPTQINNFSKIITDNSISVKMDKPGLGERENVEETESLENVESNRVFFQQWAMKEAIAKVLGQGLSFPFDSLELDFYNDIQKIYAEGHTYYIKHWAEGVAHFAVAKLVPVNVDVIPLSAF